MFCYMIFHLRMKILLLKDMFNLQSKTPKDFLTSLSNFY